MDKSRQIEIIVEKHPEGYVAYPIGLKGVVAGEGDIYKEDNITETFIAEVVAE